MLLFGGEHCKGKVCILTENIEFYFSHSLFIESPMLPCMHFSNVYLDPYTLEMKDMKDHILLSNGDHSKRLLCMLP